jgi:hypothetical protein
VNFRGALSIAAVGVLLLGCSTGGRKEEPPPAHEGRALSAKARAFAERAKADPSNFSFCVVYRRYGRNAVTFGISFLVQLPESSEISPDLTLMQISQAQASRLIDYAVMRGMIDRSTVHPPGVSPAGWNVSLGANGAWGWWHLGRELGAVLESDDLLGVACVLAGEPGRAWGAFRDDVRSRSRLALEPAVRAEIEKHIRRLVPGLGRQNGIAIRSLSDLGRPAARVVVEHVFLEPEAFFTDASVTGEAWLPGTQANAAEVLANLGYEAAIPVIDEALQGPPPDAVTRRLRESVARLRLRPLTLELETRQDYEITRPVEVTVIAENLTDEEVTVSTHHLLEGAGVGFFLVDNKGVKLCGMPPLGEPRHCSCDEAARMLLVVPPRGSRRILSLNLLKLLPSGSWNAQEHPLRKAGTHVLSFRYCGEGAVPYLNSGTEEERRDVLAVAAKRYVGWCWSKPVVIQVVSP